MSCKFTIPFSSPLDTMVERARQAVESQNGNFSGNTSEGSFDVSVMGNYVSGSYKVEGNQLHVNIENKPIFVPCGMIQAFLEKQLEGK